MSKSATNSISATNLAKRVKNQRLYNVTTTKNAQPLFAFEFIQEPTIQKQHLDTLQNINHGLSINAEVVTPQKKCTAAL